MRGASEETARRAAGEAKESRLQALARSKEAGAAEELRRIFELPSLGKGAGTVAERAQTRRTRHGDVSAGHGRSMRSSSSKPRGEQLEAEMLTDSQNLFARHGPLHPTVDLCVGKERLLWMSSTSLSSEVRRSPHARPRSGGRGWSRRGSRLIRT